MASHIGEIQRKKEAKQNKALDSKNRMVVTTEQKKGEQGLTQGRGCQWDGGGW